MEGGRQADWKMEGDERKEGKQGSASGCSVDRFP